MYYNTIIVTFCHHTLLQSQDTSNYEGTFTGVN